MQPTSVGVSVSVSGRTSLTLPLTLTLALTLTCSACGAPSAPPTPLGAPASLVANARGDGDAIVANVNGRPVWGSCVAAQASARHLTREAALKECVDFELMAQAAEKRGLASDPEVTLATRTALVSRLVQLAYEDGITDPQQLGDFWERATTKSSKNSLIWSYDHDEYRASSYVRVPLPAGATDAQVAAAKAVADRIIAAVANEPGLMTPQFVELAQRAAGDTKLEHQDVPPYRQGGLEDHYAEALFGIREIGRTTTAPIRTQWGWDIILFTDTVPASHPSPEELVPKLMPQVKQAYFPVWVSKLARSLGVRVEIDKDAEARLEKLE